MTAAFGQLLSALGYRAHPILAQISIPQGHQALVVDLQGDRYLVDIGSGSPLLEPIPLDRTFEIHRAVLAYRFGPGDEPSGWVQERLIDGVWTPFCRYDLRPADPNDRASADQRHHTLRENLGRRRPGAGTLRRRSGLVSATACCGTSPRRVALKSRCRSQPSTLDLRATCSASQRSPSSRRSRLRQTYTATRPRTHSGLICHTVRYRPDSAR